MELVSVIVPTYNRAPVLARALRSVLAQSYTALDLIVVDDGSSDGTEAVVRAVTDPRLRYIRRDNGGPGAARNTGVAVARGSYVAFLDSDDEWLPEKLAKQMARLHAAPDVGVVLCGHRVLAPDPHLYGTDCDIDYMIDAHLARGDVHMSLLTGLWYPTSMWLVRRCALDLTGPFDQSLPSCEDWDLAFRLSDHCRFECVPEVLVLKHHSRISVYSHGPGRAEGFAHVLVRHRRRWRNAPRILAEQEYKLGQWLLAELRRPILGGRYLLQALWHDPRTQAWPVARQFWREAKRRAKSVLGVRPGTSTVRR